MFVSDSGKKFPVGGGDHILSPMFWPRAKGEPTITARATKPMAKSMAIFIPSQFDRNTGLEWALLRCGAGPERVKFTHFARGSRRVCGLVADIGAFCIGFPDVRD
jgi:hypothetical protein